MINVDVLGEFNEKKKKSYSRWDVWFEKVLYTHSIFMIIIDREIYSMYNFVLYHIYKCWFMFVVPTYEAKKKKTNIINFNVAQIQCEGQNIDQTQLDWL